MSSSGWTGGRHHFPADGGLRLLLLAESCSEWRVDHGRVAFSARMRVGDLLVSRCNDASTYAVPRDVTVIAVTMGRRWLSDASRSPLSPCDFGSLHDRVTNDSQVAKLVRLL